MSFETMTAPAEQRLHQEVTLEQHCKDSDKAIEAAMAQASKKAPQGLAPELLKQAGFAYGAELYEVQAAIEERDSASPLRRLTKQQQLVLHSQGRAWLSTLLNEAEAWLADGRPASSLSDAWAAAKVKGIRSQLTAERKRLSTPQPTTAEIIATLKQEKEVALAELEKAKQIIKLLQERR